MSGGKREILLLTEAHESECTELLRLVSASGGPGLRSARYAQGCGEGGGAPRVLFIGEECAARVEELWRLHGGEFDLLISHDLSLFERPELLACSPRLLIAPYDPNQLGEHLAAVVGTPRVESLPLDLLGLNIIGDSPAIKRLLRAAANVARYDAPVLIKGETGTGKELVARAIHYSSRRCDHPFVPVNCGALNDELLLAELFGHAKGAFTDAKSARCGLIAQAQGGTLMLDEVDSLSPRAQGALLRFLQEGEYRPLGGETVLRSDVRVVSATNADLVQRVAEGRFREDLYYRLHVVDLTVPPLRARGDDVLLLAHHFLALFSRQYGEQERLLHPVTERWMRGYPWPGNVRELENYLHRIFVMSAGPSLCVPSPKGDPVQFAAPAGEVSAAVGVADFQEEKGRVIAQFERDYLRRVLRDAGGNVSLAARCAGKERRAFARLLKKHGIERGHYL